MSRFAGASDGASSPGRRRFLGLAAGAAALAVFPAATGARAGPAADELALARRLVGLFAAPGSAAEVGRRYLRAAPQEASVRRLVAAIAAGSGDGAGERAGRLDALGPAALRAELAGRIRADFAVGRLVRLDGWMLSATETRLMALAALVPGAA
jgi:hypothetical protein